MVSALALCARTYERCTRLSHAPLPLSCTQNLACGVFEMQKQEEGPEPEEELSTLTVPSAGTQTAGMSAARRAGKTLVSEVTAPDADGSSAAPSRAPAQPSSEEKERKKKKKRPATELEDEVNAERRRDV